MRNFAWFILKEKTNQLPLVTFSQAPITYKHFLSPTHLWHHIQRRSNQKRVGIFKNRT